jgi:hypothetical protein
MEFGIVSGGARIDRDTMRDVTRAPDGTFAWALLGTPIEPMLSGGEAFVEFVLEEGDGVVAPIVAPDTLDTSAGVIAADRHGLFCDMGVGWLVLDTAVVREATEGWGAPMAARERVRLVYTDATRTISVVWRGQAFDLVALPAWHDIARTRFGVMATGGNSVRITNASAPGQ